MLEEGRGERRGERRGVQERNEQLVVYIVQVWLARITC
jgi:hypothetical protein